MTLDEAIIHAEQTARTKKYGRMPQHANILSRKEGSHE